MAQRNVNPLADLIDTAQEKASRKMREQRLAENPGKELAPSVFHSYIDKRIVGLNIFREFNARIVDMGGGKMGIPMDDVDHKIGLLSQCQGLQALVSLAKDFKLGFDEMFEDVENQKGTIRQIMDAILEDVVSSLMHINEDGKERYIFDASPYDSDHFTEEYSSIETITWVLPALFQILKYHAEQHEVCKWEDTLIRIIRYGIKYINQSFINEEGAAADKGLMKGWNFTDDCEEPSLYFSFAVGECYLDFYSTFEDVLQYAYAKKNNKEYGIPIDEEIKEKHDLQAKKFLADKNKEVGPLQARHDEYNELVRLFRLINGLREDEELRIEDTRYGELAENCNTLAEAVWGYVKKDLGDKFFYNDLATTLTEDALRMSTTSDALFNSVYIVNIMIGGGMDETLQLRASKALSEGKTALADQLLREYDNLLESCQLAVQRAFRTYESLKNSGKDYIVDQFLIGFNERFNTHQAMVGELRKLRMKVFSLLPMLIHTNNVVSEYLIKYPQVNMKKYLEHIMENRYVENGQVHWIWENDGYFSGSNYYYIYALNEFYTYYEKYEEPYIDYGERNKKVRSRIIANYDEQLRAPEGEITLLKADLEKAKEDSAKKDAEILRLEQALKEVPTPVEDAVREIVNQELEAQFAGRMAAAFTQAAKALTPNAVDPTEDPAGAVLCSAMLDMLVARAFGDYYSGLRSVKDVEAFEKLAADFRSDLQGTVKAYLSDIANMDKDQSISKLRGLFDKG